MNGATAAGMTIAEATRSIGARLAAEGIEDARLDARRMIEVATGLSSERLVMEPRRTLDEAEALRLAAMVERRLAREPVSRIIGRRDFWRRSFEITPDTLDPRPDTETLVELALDLATEEEWRGKPIRILDIGTGSGCILLTLLGELGRATGVGTDISEGALATAGRNAARLGLEARVAWQRADLIDGIEGRFDLVVSNPPYIPSGDIAGLAPEVRGFDPHRALDGGSDGLDFYRRITSGIAGALAPGGWVAVEVGAGQAAAVGQLVGQVADPAAGSSWRTHKDLGGHTRCVAWKPRL